MSLKMLNPIEREVVKKLAQQGGQNADDLARRFMEVRALRVVDGMPKAVTRASKGASLNHRQPEIAPHFAAGSLGVQPDHDGAVAHHARLRAEGSEEDATIVPVAVAKKRLDKIAKRLAKTDVAKKAKRSAAKAWADSRAKAKGRTRSIVDNDSRGVDSDSGGKALPADSGDSDSADSADSGDSDSYVGDGDDVAEDLHQNAFAVGFNEGIALARRAARKSRAG